MQCAFCKWKDSWERESPTLKVIFCAGRESIEWEIDGKEVML